MKNLSLLFRWMSNPISVSVSRVGNFGIMCYGDRSHPEDDDYNGGSSYDGW